jgi:hypothetical protein
MKLIKYNYTTVTLFLVLTLTNCVEQHEFANEEYVTIVAGMGVLPDQAKNGMQKVLVNGTQAKWSANDEISVYTANNENRKFTISNYGEMYSEFSGQLNLFSNTPDIYSIYPYSFNNTVSYDSGTPVCQFDLANFQTQLEYYPTEASLESGRGSTNYMVGKGTKKATIKGVGSMAFKQVMSCLDVTIKGLPNDQKVQSLIFRTPSNIIPSRVDVNFDANITNTVSFTDNISLLVLNNNSNQVLRLMMFPADFSANLLTFEVQTSGGLVYKVQKQGALLKRATIHKLELDMTNETPLVSSDYVSDGLVLWIEGEDGIKTNGSERYVEDRVFGLKCFIVGGTNINHNAILKAFTSVRSTTSSRIVIPQNLMQHIFKNPITWEMVTLQKTDTRAIYFGSYPEGDQTQFEYKIGKSFREYGGPWGDNNAVMPNFSFNKVYSVAAGANQTKIILYYNNVSLLTKTYTALSTFDSGDFFLFSDNRTSGAEGVQMDGNIYSFRIYNRLLTAEEMAKNYAKDKARFNF